MGINQEKRIWDLEVGDPIIAWEQMRFLRQQSDIPGQLLCMQKVQRGFYLDWSNRL